VPTPNSKPWWTAFAKSWYLNFTGLEVALFLNFKEATLTWILVVRWEREENHGLRG
jgi:hypothetical protein